MSNEKLLIVLDLEGGAPNGELLAAWRNSCFLERLEALGSVVTFGARIGTWPEARTAAQLADLADARGAEALVLVEPTQVFLDPALAAAGLEGFEPAYHDVFTQWEHCRLPVGIGVRAISMRAFREVQPALPSESYGRVIATPKGRKFAYELRHEVSYEESLADARWRPELAERLSESEPASWGLDGWRAFVSGLDGAERNALAYRPETQAPRVDERNMAAAYGFESAACAVFPTYVMFDITNVCNAACVHCPQSITAADGGRPDFLAKHEHQTLAAFRQVIDECSAHDVRFVRITADGEPLVHPELFEMLEYAREKGPFRVGLTTNGSLVKAKQAERLLDSGLALIDFSLDAATRDTFEKIRVGLRYDRVHENVMRFLELREQRGSDVRVIVSFVKQARNADEVEAFRSYWEPLVDEVIVREMISNVGLNSPTENHWPGWDHRWPCAHFFRRVVINHRGQLKACPIDWEQKTVNRHVSEASIFDQWHGSFYWKHRMQHLSDTISNDSACKNCPDWAGTPWELGYEKIVARLAEVGERAA